MDQSRSPSTSARTRTLVGLGLTVTFALMVVVLLRSTDGSTGTAPSVVAPSSTTDPAVSAGDAEVPTSVTSTPSSSAVPAVPGSTRAVAEPVLVELIDDSRAVTSGNRTIDSVRRLPTTVWRPTAPGSHPLIIFAHGYQVGPMTYARFCAALAARGYVVAAPSFPLADESRGNGLDREDIANQAIDVDFVIASLRADDPTVDDGPVGVIGHSDGGTVALLVAERPSAMNPAVGAVIAIAPDMITGELTSSPPPLLIIHSIDDPISAFVNGQAAFDSFAGHRLLLALEGADHLTPVVGGTPWTSVIDRAVHLFLAGTLPEGSTADLAAVASELDGLDLSHVLSAS